MPELMEEIIHPGALETKSQLEEDLGEMVSQLSGQLTRVRELRVKKVEQPGMGVLVLLLGLITNTCLFWGFPDAFYGDDEVDLHNIDVMTDVSMAPTAFTRYTVAPSTASKKSRFVPVTWFKVRGGTNLFA